MKAFYDVVIIGSGFGGAVTACRLAQARRDDNKPVSICVIERGRRYHMGEFPRNLLRSKDWWWDKEGQRGWTGLVDHRRLGEMDVIMGAGVGGTSLIYLDVQIGAFDTIWDTVGSEGNRRWPKSVDWREEMPRYYEKVREMMRPTPVPNPPLKTLALKASADSIGQPHRFRLLDLAVYWGKPGVRHSDPYGRGGPTQTGCDYCGECYIGCNSHSKNTLDLNYLWMAQQAGAEVYSMHKAVGIAPNKADHPQHPLGYTVHFEDLRWNWRGSVSAGKVVFSAGTVNTTELLLRAKYGYRQRRKRFDPTLPNLGDMLGRYFSGNGDFGVIGFETNRNVSPNRGHTITGVVDYSDQFDGCGFIVEEGGLPDLIRAHFRRKPGGLSYARYVWNRLRSLLRRHGGYDLLRGLLDFMDYDTTRDALMLLIMGIDTADGKMTIDEEGWLNIQWNTATNRTFFRTIEKTLRDLVEGPPPGLDGNLFLNPTWSMQKQLITVHPLGGCPMGDDDTKGVISPEGEVYNYPNLYVVDGSIVPSALGANPSMTIAALGERISEKIIEKGIA
jgi:cholesterol oxidase